MAAGASSVILSRVGLAGVAGLPQLELELGAVTALVGTRGSGKSQLLAAVAWLIAGAPPLAPSTAAASARVWGRLRHGGRVTEVVRPARAALQALPGGRPPATPRCSFVRARDRLGALPAPSAGAVATRLADETARQVTSDAMVAEALVATVEACCAEGVHGELLLIEEPELLLTPQAQRYLYRLLRRFADAGNQVIYSTRSAAFVDAARHDEIVRLDLHPAGRVHRASAQLLSDAQRLRLAAEFDHERSEMFFARAVVLVEGQTERQALPLVFRALGHDPDAAGVSIVEVGGKANLPPAARLLGALQIPFVVVFDADRGAAAAALDREIRDAAGGAALFRLGPDFEAAAGLASREEKVLQAWRRFSTAAAPDIPPALAAIVAATMRCLQPDGAAAVPESRP